MDSRAETNLKKRLHGRVGLAHFNSKDKQIAEAKQSQGRAVLLSGLAVGVVGVRIA